MTTAKHTETPWETDVDELNALVQAVDGDANDEFPVCVCQGPDAASNAAFIVRTGNSHDALLAACKVLLERMEVNELGVDSDPLPYDRPAVNQARAAIALAEGTP